jgi:argininosuccinate synthase
LKLYKGRCWAVGRRARQPLYDKGLATYESGDTFDHDAATGFIGIFGLPLRTQAHQQWLGLTSDQILRLSAGGANVHEEPPTSPSELGRQTGPNPAP